MKISERAMIAKLSIKSWGGSVVDHEVTEEVSHQHKASLKGAGRYSKTLVAGHFKKPLNSAISKARQTHLALTLPWGDDGARILAANGYLHYDAQMLKRRQDFERQVDLFCKGVDLYKQEAEQRLGDMYDPSDYPNEKDLREMYSMSVDIENVSEAGDFRAELPEDAVKAIVDGIEHRNKVKMTNAMNDVFKRVESVAAKMSKSLKEYKPATSDSPAENIFKDTLVTNIKDQADLLDALNITGDERISKIKDELLEGLVEHSPEILRSDKDARRETQAKADAILKKVRSFME